MLTAFLVIGGVGLALLVISLIVGEVHGALFDWIDNDLFSGAVVAAFLSALGFVGALVEGTSGNSTTATVAGVGAGVGMGYAARALTRSLQSGEGDTTVRSDALVGRQGHVVEAIPGTAWAWSACGWPAISRASTRDANNRWPLEPAYRSPPSYRPRRSSFDRS